MSHDYSAVTASHGAQLDEYLRLEEWMRDAGDLVDAAAELFLRCLTGGGRVLAWSRAATEAAPSKPSASPPS